jgi:hypothetical protein
VTLNVGMEPLVVDAAAKEWKMIFMEKAMANHS